MDFRLRTHGYAQNTQDGDVVMVVTTNKKSRFYFEDILKKFKNQVREFFRLVFLINIFKRQYTNYLKKGGHSEGF